MLSDKNDIFGGLFDLDGDGKTDIGEEYIAYKIIEDVLKEEDENFDNFTSRPESTQNTVHNDTAVLPFDPANLTPRERYEHFRSELKTNVFSCTVVFIFVMFPVFIVNWAAIRAYDRENSASVFFIAAFLVIGSVITGCLLYVIICNIGNAIKQVKNAKDVFLRSITKEEREAFRKESIRHNVISWLLFLFAVIGIIELIYLF